MDFCTKGRVETYKDVNMLLVGPPVQLILDTRTRGALDHTTWVRLVQETILTFVLLPFPRSR